MKTDSRQAIRDAARKLAPEGVYALHELSAIPANAATGEGYDETVRWIAHALEASGLAPNISPIPADHLRACWGREFEYARDYLNIDPGVPRSIVTASIDGARAGVGCHLTNNYDLYWGPRKERAGTIAQLIAMKALKASGVELPRAVFLSATPDGYTGGDTGAGYVAAQSIGRSHNVLAASLGAPEVITVGYKGLVWAKISIVGKPAHGSRPHEGKNAIDAMAWVQSEIAQMARRYAVKRTDAPIWPDEANAPTVSVCRIAGNLNSTFIAADCSLFVDRRINPGESVRDVIDEFEDLVARAREATHMDVSLSIPHTVEPSRTSVQSALYRSLERNVADARGAKPSPVIWSHYLGLHYFTEAWGSDALAYTPGRVGHGKVDVGPEDDQMPDEDLGPAIEAIALTAFDAVHENLSSDGA